MPKISVSLPEETLQFVDSLGPNRSKAIVEILQDFQQRQRNKILAEAYDAYSALCAVDDGDWWPDWESAALSDLAKEPASEP